MVPTLLFGILSPGLLLTLPAESRGFWLSGTPPPSLLFPFEPRCLTECTAGQTSTRAIVAHTIVFGAVLALVRSLWPSKKATSK